MIILSQKVHITKRYINTLSTASSAMCAMHVLFTAVQYHITWTLLVRAGQCSAAGYLVTWPPPFASTASEPGLPSALPFAFCQTITHTSACRACALHCEAMSIWPFGRVSSNGNYLQGCFNTTLPYPTQFQGSTAELPNVKTTESTTEYITWCPIKQQ